MIPALKALIDRTTMYRLVLYYVAALYAAAIAFAYFGLLPFSITNLAWSLVVLSAFTWLTNEALAWIFGVDTNLESFLITALILALILPPVSFASVAGSMDYAVIASWAAASKFVFSIGKKHLFNPAALAVVLSSYLLGISATWWVGGTLVLMPLVILGGAAVVYKLRRWDLVLSFFVVALATIALTSLAPLGGLKSALLHSSLFFLAFAMLTEPLTMPATEGMRMAYGGIVGFLFAPALHFGSLYLSPELALLVGNIFSYVVSPKGRHALTLVSRKRLAEGIYEFGFKPDRPLAFAPGQYLEWTLGGVPFDSRGNRRYFTIASAPEDARVALGVRFYDEPSGFKQALASLSAGDAIAVGSLGGDFTLPADPARKLAFLAGGIGVTPFASMARHMVAAEAPRDAVLLYSSKTAREVAYQGEFAEAAAYGLRTVYALTDEEPQVPGVQHGFIDAAFIEHEIPDYKERLFYVSGPPGMVDSMKYALHTLGVPRLHVKTDYFPGLA